MLKDDTLADEIITQQIALFRFTASERAAVLVLLKQMEEELLELLAYSGKSLTDIGREDKARLLRQAQAVIADYYERTSARADDQLGELASVEAKATAGSLSTALRAAVTPALPTPAVLRRLVTNSLIQGAPSAAWWQRQSGDTSFRFANAVRQGIAQAETNAQIIRRVRSDVGGVLQVSRANAAALVQTSVQTIANEARRETFLANDDVVKGIRQVSTLDGHTTPVCIAYSGATWSLPDYKPTSPEKLPYNGGTPRHWGCRSVEVGVTRTFKELGIDLPEFDPSTTTRAATGGPVSADTTFGAFLKRQEQKGPAFVDDLLGPGRAELWRDGKITLAQLVDQQGRPLTLDELRKRYG